MAVRPNQVWCWDISKVKGERLRQFFDLYLVMDIYSRYIVGWRVEHTEVSATAADMLTQAVNEAPHAPEYLHSDNGASMKSNIMADTLAGHGIARSLSRPKVSNDNPFSESLFKTFKYETSYPRGFPTLEAAASTSPRLCCATTTHTNTKASPATHRRPFTTAKSMKSTHVDNKPWTRATQRTPPATPAAHSHPNSTTT